MSIIPEKIGIDFSDEAITGSAGSIYLSRMSRLIGLPGLLNEALHLKERRRGASDTETMLSLIYCMAQETGRWWMWIA